MWKVNHLGMISQKNGFDYSKFGANTSNLVLMLKKIGGGCHYNFIFS
jgi:hypothetical protein